MKLSINLQLKKFILGLCVVIPMVVSGETMNFGVAIDPKFAEFYTVQIYQNGVWYDQGPNEHLSIPSTGIGGQTSYQLFFKPKTSDVNWSIYAVLTKDLKNSACGAWYYERGNLNYWGGVYYFVDLYKRETGVYDLTLLNPNSLFVCLGVGNPNISYELSLSDFTTANLKVTTYFRNKDGDINSDKWLFNNVKFPISDYASIRAKNQVK
jgi:hypothetical protein